MERIISNRVETIRIDDIKPSPVNPRRKMDADETSELAMSIAAVGLLQPITVRPMVDVVDAEKEVIDEYYEIVCGHRRYEAAKLAGLDEVPCIVRTLSDDEAYDIMVTENLQRKDIDPFEESGAFNVLLARGSSVKDLSVKFGKSETYVRSRCALSALLPEFREKYDAGLVRLTHCIILAALEPDMQRKMLETYYSGGYADISCKGVDALRGSINGMAADIKDAPFDSAPCRKCRHNLASGELFPDEGRALCSNLRCYAVKYAGAQLHWFEEARDGNPDFFIIEPVGLRLSAWDAALADLLRDRGFEFRRVDDYKYRPADGPVSRFDHKDGTAVCYFFGWGGMRFECQSDTSAEKTAPRKLDWLLDRLAAERQDRTEEYRCDVAKEAIDKLEDDALKAKPTLNIETVLKAAICRMYEDYEDRLPFGLSGENGVGDLDAADMAQLGTALAKIVALNTDSGDSGQRYVEQMFPECFDGAREKGEKMFMDECRKNWQGYDEVTDEMIEEDLAERVRREAEQ
ncbi:MAG: ParB/RepB/Spo0J family partition protein [Bacteroidales bacterium]|nr:ParB/RepB/Spo0J family partition protein [Bacteroidales bacterium]